MLLFFESPKIELVLSLNSQPPFAIRSFSVSKTPLDPEGWDGEGGGRGDQSGEHM